MPADSWPSRSDGRLHSSEDRKVAIHIDCWAVDRILETDFFNGLPRSEEREARAGPDRLECQFGVAGDVPRPDVRAVAAEMIVQRCP